MIFIYITRDILKQYKELLTEEEQLKQQIEMWHDKLGSATLADGMPRSSVTSKPTERLAEEIIKIKHMLLRKQIEVAEEYNKIEKTIESLPIPIYRIIMRDYYLNDNTWEQVAVNHNYSIGHIWRMHGEALKMIIKDESK